MVKPWKTLSSEVIFDVGFFNVHKERVQSPRTGDEMDFYLLQMPDWVQVVPETAEGRVVLVRRYRLGSRRSGLEVPGGLVDPGDATPMASATREMSEETGYGGGEVISLGSFFTQPALLTNRVSFFLVKGVEPRGAPRLDAGEDMEVVLVALADIERKIADGSIHNTFSLTALMLAQKELAQS